MQNRFRPVALCGGQFENDSAQPKTIGWATSRRGSVKIAAAVEHQGKFRIGSIWITEKAIERGFLPTTQRRRQFKDCATTQRRELYALSSAMAGYSIEVSLGIKN